MRKKRLATVLRLGRQGELTLTALPQTLYTHTHTHTHTRLTALCQGLPGRAGTRKVIPVWIILKRQ